MAEKGEVFDVIGFEQPKVSTRARFGRLLEYENVGGAIEGDDLAFEFVAQRCPDRKQAPHRQLLRVAVDAAVVPTLHCCVFLLVFFFCSARCFNPSSLHQRLFLTRLFLHTMFLSGAFDDALVVWTVFEIVIWARFHKNSNSVS